MENCRQAFSQCLFTQEFRVKCKLKVVSSTRCSGSLCLYFPKKTLEENISMAMTTRILRTVACTNTGARLELDSQTFRGSQLAMYMKVL